MLTLEDKFAICEVINLYGHILDRKAFSELNQIFTEDAIFDLSGFDSSNARQKLTGKAYYGLREIVSMMTQSNQHPVAHHATNIVIDSPGEANNEVHVQSKGIGVGRNGRVGSVFYQDTLVKYKDEWRISFRHVQLLKEDRQYL